MDTLGKRLRHARKNLGLTQSEFAEKLGVSKQSIISWEHDKIVPTRTNVQTICDVFGISQKWLEFGDGQMKEREQFDDILKKYNITSAIQKRIVSNFIQMDSAEREIFLNLLEKIMQK